AEQRRFFEMETDLAGERSAFRVAAADYDSLAWVPERVGAGAIIAPGYQCREHARVAIQQLSGIPPRRTSYAHLGWREVDGAWIYLHAGGALGADGPVDGADVQVQDTLSFFELPAVPAGDAVDQAVRASLEILEAAPAEVAFPVLAATYRAPLGPCSHGVHLTGQTGTGKSAFAALAQQHFGRAMDGEHLPASWTSTANYLEGFLFAAKDALVVVDDLTLGTSRRDVEAAQRLAERVYRAQGNQQGRGRMRADSTLRPTKYPRGLTLGTSEDLPAGQSLRARVLIVEFGPNTVDWSKLSALQDAGARGLFASAMTGYIRWLAGAYGDRLPRRERRLAELRHRAQRSNYHRRTPGVIASLALGLETFLEFADESAIFSSTERAELFEAGWRALGEAAERQLPHQTDSDPAARFLSLLGSAITAGDVHLADAKTGDHPDFPERWGWKPEEFGSISTWRSSGSLVGWIDGTQLYLDLDIALGAVQKLAGALGQHLAITPTVLSKQLYERGLLLSTELSMRQTYRVRATLADRRRPVLHLALTVLEPEGEGPKLTVPTLDPTSRALGETETEGAAGRNGQAATEDEESREASADQRPLDGLVPPTGHSSPSPDLPDHTDRPRNADREKGRWTTEL
nr:DUF927 domain-containing protein [Gemmatimonadales bacterium]